jgi:hypothetical protein
VLGVVDYRDADWHSPTWWKRWRYLVQAMDEQSHGTLLAHAFKFQLALVSNSRISTEDFSKTQKEAKELFADLEGNLRPWLGRDREDRKEREHQTFREQWQEVAGFDPMDKEAVAKWGEEIKKFTRAAAETRTAAEQEKNQSQEVFQQKLKAIQLKRLSQQGRKR